MGGRRRIRTVVTTAASGKAAEDQQAPEQHTHDFKILHCRLSIKINNFLTIDDVDTLCRG